MDSDVTSGAVNCLPLKEIRLVYGESYPPIITVEEAAQIARFAAGFAAHMTKPVNLHQLDK